MSQDAISAKITQSGDNARALEIKEAHRLFASVWTSLKEESVGASLRMPKEIFWLNGAPGSGKGTNGDFILQSHGLTASPLVVSSLLKSPEAERMKDAGMLVGDREVIEILLRKLLNPAFASGAVVDGFPRNKIQAETVKQLYQKMMDTALKYKRTADSEHFQSPIFYNLVLFIDEKESVRRQLNRGKEAQSHNQMVQEAKVGELREVRVTDLDPKAALKRYHTFQEKTCEALQELGKHFPCNRIDGHGSIKVVRRRIEKELRFQRMIQSA